MPPAVAGVRVLDVNIAVPDGQIAFDEGLSDIDRVWVGLTHVGQFKVALIGAETE